MWKNIPKNYVDEKYPELIYLFKNLEDAHNGVASSKKVDFKCPCCGNIYNRPITQIVKSGRVPCPTCNDGFSYPEKFMANVLNELNVQFKYHINEPWTQNYIYDFLFEFNNRKYIIETDGALGYGHKTIGIRTIETTLEIDNIKDDIAKNNGYQMIRIDCNYPDGHRFEYIKNSIIESLSFIFDLSKITWNKCHIQSLESNFKKIIDLYKNETRYLDELEEKSQIKKRTIIKYITEAMNSGIIEKDIILSTNPYKNIPKNIKFIKGDQYRNTNKLIYCFEDSILFDSMTTAANYYNFNRGSFLQSKKNNVYCIKGKHFDFYENLPDDFDFKPKIYSANEYSRNKHIFQFDKNTHKLIAEYDNKQQLLQAHPNYNYGNIWRVCSKKRNTAYGFVWSYEKLLEIAS